MGHLETIYGVLKSGGFTEAAVLAMMGNWQCESGLEANRLQGDHNPYRTNSKNYVERARLGQMTKEEFCRGIGFGLAQWTLPVRKANLWDFWKNSGYDLDDPVMQTRFCLWELLNHAEYTELLTNLRTKTDIYTLTKQICAIYERPEVQNVDDRFRAAQELKERFKEIQNGSKTGKGETRMTKNQAIKKVVDLAVSEVGYHEKASNANLDSKTANSGSGNFTKYAQYLDKLGNFYNGPKNGYAWCDIFVDWLFVQCFGVETGRQMLCQPTNSAGAGCLYSAQYYKNAGRWTTTPEAGEQIFFSYSAGEYSHTGIVTEVQNGSVTTVEGNSSDQVAKRKYAANDPRIVGYGVPKWELATGEAGSTATTSQETIAVAKPAEILRKGSMGVKVKELQNNLIRLGYDLGSYGADGDFGNDTLKAVMKFQQDHGLEVDGQVGPKTSSAIERAISKYNSNISTGPSKEDEQTVVVGTPEPKEEEKVFCSIGDVVAFTGDTCYISYGNDTMPTKCKPGQALVVNVNKSGRHPYQLCKINGHGSTVYGWVDYTDVNKVS